MGKIRLIIWREYWTRVRKKSFLIMTILGPVLIVGAIMSTVFLAMQENGPQNVLIIDKAQILTNKLSESEDVKFFYDGNDISDSVFKASPYTAMIDVNEKVLENNTIQLFYKDLPSMTTQNYVSAEIEKVIEQEKLRVNNVDPVTYQRIKTALNIQLFDIDKGGKRSYEQVKAGLGFAFGYMIFIFIFLYGVQVMRGVMEEKQNRVVEVLISSVRPFQLMMGKIIGIAMVGLTQFLLWVGITAILIVIGMGVASDKFSKLASEQAPGQVTVQLQQKMGMDAAQAEKKDNAENYIMVKEILAELPIAKIIGCSSSTSSAAICCTVRCSLRWVQP